MILILWPCLAKALRPDVGEEVLIKEDVGSTEGIEEGEVVSIDGIQEGEVAELPLLSGET